MECYLGNIKMLMDNNFFDIDVLIAPQKNTVVTFAATCFKDDQDKIDIRKVSSTATFQIGDMDYVTGNAFIANDGSELCLQSDGTFANYRSSDDSYHICLDTFYALILHSEQYIDASNESSEAGTTTLFIGYYIPELQMLDMTNANAASYAQFTYKGPA